MSTPDTVVSNTEAFSFELDRLELVGKRLELRGRWSGIRGRRFVRPTLTMRVNGAKHRALADLKHKPWAAEDGEDWVAFFSSVPQAADAEQIEMTVAPDIAISLPVPVARVPAATPKRSQNGAGAPARTASPRKAKSDQARRVLEQERESARDLVRKLELAEAGLGRLTSERDALAAERDELAAEREALAGERDVLITERKALAGGRQAMIAKRDELVTERDRLAAGRDALIATRDALVTERDALVTERTSLRDEHARLVKRVAELESGLGAPAPGGGTGLAEARDALEAERAETERLRSQLAAAQSEARLPARGVPARSRGRSGLHRRRRTVWAIRAFTLIAMCAVIAIVVVLINSPYSI